MRMIDDFDAKTCEMFKGEGVPTLGEWVRIGFRFTAAAAAEEYGATGWVKNEADESVSMELQGSEKQLRRVLDALNQNDYIRINRTESEPLAVIPKERKFEIKF